MRHEQQKHDSTGWLSSIVLTVAVCGFVVLVVWARPAPVPKPAPCCKCPADLGEQLAGIASEVETVGCDASDAQADAAWCKAKVDEQRATIECLRMRLDAIDEAKAKAWRAYEEEYLAYLKEYEKWRASREGAKNAR